MSDQVGILPEWFSNQGIILAKGQLDHSNGFWTSMLILIFSLGANVGHHPLCTLRVSMMMMKRTLDSFTILLTLHYLKDSVILHFLVWSWAKREFFDSWIHISLKKQFQRRFGCRFWFFQTEETWNWQRISWMDSVLLRELNLASFSADLNLQAKCYL